MNQIVRSLFLLSLLVATFHMNAQEFVNPLQIPPRIHSDSTAYHLNVIETEHNFNPNGTDSLNRMIRTFAFEDGNQPGTNTILGPTIAWQYGNWQTPKVTNLLDEVTTCHWHGAHVPTPADGGPHQRIQPGMTWSPEFEILDKSATMWYHPHAMGLTYEHVQMGLSGMIYVEDPDGEDSLLTAIHELLPTSYGINDFPLIFQSKKFMRDSMGEIVIQSELGYKKDYVYMVNGRVDPYLVVPHGMVRFRVLNGDGKFAFNFGLGSGSAFDSLGFHLIATDAGYTDQSYELNQILMAPGERTEWLVDFSKFSIGDTLHIYNHVSSMPKGLVGDAEKTDGYAKDRSLLRIIVGPDDAPVSPISSFPVQLVPLETPPLSEVTRVRTKTFRFDPFLIDGSTQRLFNIDSTLMDMRVVNEVVKMDSTEIWTIVNTTDLGHPFHIHDIHFWVTEIVDSNGVSIDKSKYPYLFNGPKDNVFVLPQWTVSFITTFSDFGTQIQFDSSYMYHCHILPHEDRGMMGQFVVWNGEMGPVSTEDRAMSTRELAIYPNPASDYFILDARSQDVSQLRLIDMQGRVQQRVELPPIDGAIAIKTNALPAGTYILHWTTAEGHAVTRVVIE